VELHERAYGNTVVVDIRGPVKRESGGTTELVEALRGLVRSTNYKTILLNVEDLVDIDSVILGAITQAHTTAMRSGVDLRLLNVTARMRDLLALTKLDRFIAIVESEPKELGG
jgi:anti-sigma B factor antagonist